MDGSNYICTLLQPGVPLQNCRNAPIIANQEIITGETLLELHNFPIILVVEIQVFKPYFHTAAENNHGYLKISCP